MGYLSGEGLCFFSEIRDLQSKCKTSNQSNYDQCYVIREELCKT